MPDQILAERFNKKKREQYSIEERRQSYYMTIAAQGSFMRNKGSNHLRRFQVCMRDTRRRSDFYGIGSEEDERAIKKMNKKIADKTEKRRMNLDSFRLDGVLSILAREYLKVIYDLVMEENKDTLLKDLTDAFGRSIGYVQSSVILQTLDTQQNGNYQLENYHSSQGTEEEAYGLSDQVCDTTVGRFEDSNADDTALDTKSVTPPFLHIAAEANLGYYFKGRDVEKLVDVVYKLGSSFDEVFLVLGASCIQGTISLISIVGSISSEGFLSLILLVVVIIALVVIVEVVIVVVVIGVVIVVSGVSFIVKLSFMVVGFLYRIVFPYMLY
ncbi:hypothetical protein Tco_0533171 [Tanacetum coccineum]